MHTTTRKTKGQYVKVCPHCKSTDVSLDKSTLQETGQLPPMFICNACEHSGYVFPEVLVTELPHFEREVDKHHVRAKGKDSTPLIDPSFGNNEVRVVWKFAAPLMVVIGIYLLFAWRSPSDVVIGSLILLLGAWMGYVSYGKKRALQDPS